MRRPDRLKYTGFIVLSWFWMGTVWANPLPVSVGSAGEKALPAQARILLAGAGEIEEAPPYRLAAGQTTGSLVKAASGLHIEGVVEGDLVAAAGEVTITGEVRGDLIAAAGSISLDGEVTGDVIAACGEFNQSGRVAGDLLVAAGKASLSGVVEGSGRVFAADVDLSGEIHGNLQCFASQVKAMSSGRIGGRTIIFSEKARFGGQADGSARFWSKSTVLGGSLADDVYVQGDELALEPELGIGGDLQIRTPARAEPPPGASIGGRYQWEQWSHPELPRPQLPWQGFSVIRFLWAWLALWVVGAVVLALFPRALPTWSRMAMERSWLKGIVGLLGMGAIPVVVVLLCLTLLGLPLGLMLGALYGGALYLASLPIALLVGAFVLRPRENAANPYLVLLVGAGIIKALGALPFVGMALSFIALLWGLGTLLAAAWEGIRERLEHGEER